MAAVVDPVAYDESSLGWGDQDFVVELLRCAVFRARSRRRRAPTWRLFDESGLDTEFGQTAGEGLATNSGPLSERIRVGSVLSGIGAYLSVRFLTRYLANVHCAHLGPIA